MASPKNVSVTREIKRFGPKIKPLELRFFAKVEQGPGCWLWQGHTNGAAGYGLLYDRDTGRKELAHRVSWRLAYGTYPSRPLLHKCDNPRCVKPEHLAEGSDRENMLDKVLKGRATNQWDKQVTETDVCEAKRLHSLGVPKSPVTRGIANARTTLTEDQVRSLRAAKAAGIPVSKLMSRYKVSSVTIYNICSGRTW